MVLFVPARTEASDEQKYSLVAGVLAIRLIRFRVPKITISVVSRPSKIEGHVPLILLSKDTRLLAKCTGQAAYRNTPQHVVR